ncbi:tripartite tricarboxylate transporter substrate binding protein [Pseudorhodoplanes sp.]|uniref:Bug family tripartite tricarboxylate transporter substrate binding protein n=1 Tax=Pseudorhodoplanes sp. TaxID=1934341 RepID=UPI002C71BCB2|nr:tripartite tricarboxylate transporter substrate binding protein [Pseudorhodoplanes sp.]HWV42165.1 tripartite tricarboxylate transporter substrate binding protein [Pseudorhodoplanes sp.]
MMTTLLSRRAALTTALAVASLVIAAPAFAQAWKPTQPIKVIIPYAPGGTSDIIARSMSDQVSARLDQPLTIENRGGGATQIGTSAVAKAAPDGHTILLVGNTVSINPSLFKSLPYDTLKDLAPITYAGVTPHTIVVNNDVPAKNLKELLDLAKAKPGQINYGSVGIGTSFHLGTEELKKLSGTNMVHVPYKGMGQVLTDAISGNIQMAFANTPNAAPLVQAGKLRAIAVAHPKRVAQLPDVPTVGEQGFPGFESNSGFIYFAPGGTPEPVLDRLNAVFVEVLNLPEVKEALTKQGVEVMATSRADTLDFIKREMKRYAEVVAFSGAKAE